MSACMGLIANGRQADFESQIETTKSIECANAFRQLITYSFVNDSMQSSTQKWKLTSLNLNL